MQKIARQQKQIGASNKAKPPPASIQGMGPHLSIIDNEHTIIALVPPADYGAEYSASLVFMGKFENLDGLDPRALERVWIKLCRGAKKSA